MQLPEVDAIRLTSVVDNFVDNLLRDEGPARRRPRKGKSYERCLCAEHGLAEMVESQRGTSSFPLLFDFGATPLVYLHNLQLLVEDYGVDLGRIGDLVLSHGHWDHYGGLCAMLETRRHELPESARLWAGIDAFSRRWRATATGIGNDMGILDEAFIRARNIDIVKVTGPELLGGQALVSGKIPRRTDYEVSSPAMRVELDGRDIEDTMLGEQALVYHLRGKGLVVLTACGHAGVVNTVMHAREATGVDRVHAIIGGFHLSGESAARIDRTVEGLAAFDPDLIVPMHCTGLATIEALRDRLPGRVIYNSAGTRYELKA